MSKTVVHFLFLGSLLIFPSLAMDGEGNPLTPNTITIGVPIPVDHGPFPVLDLNIGSPPRPMQSLPPSVTAPLQTRFEMNGLADPIELPTTAATSPRTSCGHNDLGYDESSDDSASVSTRTSYYDDEEDALSQDDDFRDKWGLLAEEIELKFLHRQWRGKFKAENRRSAEKNYRSSKGRYMKELNLLTVTDFYHKRWDRME